MTGIKKYVIPPPELPQPPINAFEDPTTFLSKNPVDQTWQGTNVPPRIPTKNRNAKSPCQLLTKPAIAVGMEPASKMIMYVHRGPNRSHNGPATKRTRSVPVNAAILVFAICSVVRLRLARIVRLSSGVKAYHDQNAMKKPNQEKKNTLPYLLTGFKTGILRAFWLIGLIVGALHKLDIAIILTTASYVEVECLTLCKTAPQPCFITTLNAPISLAK